jgi:hypothetical protein
MQHSLLPFSQCVSLGNRLGENARCKVGSDENRHALYIIKNKNKAVRDENHDPVTLAWRCSVYIADKDGTLALNGWMAY